MEDATAFLNLIEWDIFTTRTSMQLAVRPHIVKMALLQLKPLLARADHTVINTVEPVLYGELVLVMDWMSTQLNELMKNVSRFARPSGILFQSC